MNTTNQDLGTASVDTTREITLGDRPNVCAYKPIGTGYCWICGESFFHSNHDHSRKWDAPEYWQGVTVGYCQGCGKGHVLKDKFCHNCRLREKEQMLSST